MNRTEHRAGAAAAALGVAYVTAAGPATAALLTGGALMAAMLPDLDNARWWRRADALLPDEVLGNSGPLNHRGVLHWWGWPAFAYAATRSLDAPWWVLAAITGLVVGIVSHLALDVVWGRPGVPLLPWWGHLGVGLRNDSVSAVLGKWALIASALVLSYAITTGTTIDPTILTKG